MHPVLSDESARLHRTEALRAAERRRAAVPHRHPRSTPAARLVARVATIVRNPRREHGEAEPCPP